jgi:hypothetical protein
MDCSPFSIACIERQELADKRQAESDPFRSLAFLGSSRSWLPACRLSMVDRYVARFSNYSSRQNMAAEADKIKRGVPCTTQKAADIPPTHGTGLMHKAHKILVDFHYSTSIEMRGAATSAIASETNRRNRIRSSITVIHPTFLSRMVPSFAVAPRCGAVLRATF